MKTEFQIWLEILKVLLISFLALIACSIVIGPTYATVVYFYLAFVGFKLCIADKLNKNEYYSYETWNDDYAKYVYERARKRHSCR